MYRVGLIQGTCTPIKNLYAVDSPKLGFGFFLDSIYHRTVTIHRFVRHQLRELNHSLAILLCSSLFLLVFFNSQARISLCGDVNLLGFVPDLSMRGVE
jgi:hypothetical protein